MRGLPGLSRLPSGSLDDGDIENVQETEEDGDLAEAPLVEVIPPEEIDVLDLEEIVMWGLEAADSTGTFVYGRNPLTGHRVSGSFASAEQARAFFSRWGRLRLLYA